MGSFQGTYNALVSHDIDTGGQHREITLSITEAFAPFLGKID